MDEKIFTHPKRPKIGLALSGGVALGWAHIGALKALTEHKIPIDCVAGTSAGALIAALYAFGVPISKMVAQSDSLNWYDIFSFSRSRLGLARNKAVGRLLNDLIGQKRIEEANIPLAIMTANIQTGEKVVLSSGELCPAITASSAMPGIFIPIEINGQMLVDGGVAENLPLSPLYDFGAELTVGVDLAHFRRRKKPKHAIDVILSTYDILVHSQTHAASSRADVLIQPHLEEFTAADFKRADELVAAGYQSALEKVPQIIEAARAKIAARAGKSPWDFITHLFEG